jgi:hypothetical protein
MNKNTELIKWAAILFQNLIALEVVSIFLNFFTIKIVHKINIS